MTTKTLKICNKCLCAICGNKDCKRLSCSICNLIPVKNCEGYEENKDEE